MQAQCLLDHVVQLRNLAQRMETHLLAVGVEFVEFLDHLGVDVGVPHQLDQRPRRRARAGVVPGEHQRDEHSGDLVGREPRVAVLVLDRHQHIEHVAVALVGGRVGDSPVHDLLHQRHEPNPRLVADAEALDRQVRVDVAQRIGAALEVVVEVGEPGVELIAELHPDQAGRRGVDGQLGEEVEQVDLAFVAPLGDHPLDLRPRWWPRGPSSARRAARNCAASPLGAPGSASNTTPSPKIGVMNGYASAWSRSLVGGPEEELVGLRRPRAAPPACRRAGTSRRRRIRRGPAASARSDRCGTPRDVRVPLHRRKPAAHRCGSHCPGIPSFTECELLTLAWVVGQRGFGLKLHVGDEAAPRASPRRT